MLGRGSLAYVCCRAAAATGDASLLELALFSAMAWPFRLIILDCPAVSVPKLSSD
jgi:hypothetical protein